MKKARHKKILSLINEYNIDRQEVLLEYLQKEGFNVTQATVSRDIKELGLIKKSGENGVYKYIEPMAGKSKQNIFVDIVTSIDYAINIVVIKCHNGMAQAACAALDSMNYSNIVGTIAGDDTIFAVMRTEYDAKKLVKAFKELIWG